LLTQSRAKPAHEQVVAQSAGSSSKMPLRRGPRRRLRAVIPALVVVFGVIVFAAPLIIVVVTALQPEFSLIQRGPAALPEHFDLGNFAAAWTNGDLATYYRNSLLILVVKVPIGIVVASLAAYPLAKVRFWLRRPVLVVVLVGLGVPQVITLYPLLETMRHIGFGGSLWALLLPYLAFGMPFEVLIMRGAFAKVPLELVEAARIDGASERFIWLRVCMPMVLPAVASLAILDGVATWNEFVIALTLLGGQSNDTLPLGILNLQGQFQTNYAQLEAGVILCILPMILLFVVARKYLTQGVASGALKS
jgi:raffinose/stachyose/melibiose transport system permease protein